jgi:hypothetical protein
MVGIVRTLYPSSKSEQRTLTGQLRPEHIHRKTNAPDSGIATSCPSGALSKAWRLGWFTGDRRLEQPAWHPGRKKPYLIDSLRLTLPFVGGVRLRKEALAASFVRLIG